MREATEASKRGDISLATARLEAVRDLRPDYPRALLGLARLYAAAGRGADSLAQLHQLAALGVTMDVASDATLASLKDAPDLPTLVSRFTANGAPQGEVTPAFVLEDMTGIIESLAHDAATGTWYFTDVRNRCLWRRTSAGELTRLGDPAAPLLGVFDVKIDHSRDSLWLSTSMLPEVSGYTDADQGRAELVEFALSSGQLRRRLPLPVAPGGRALGSLTLAADGTVYATDSVANEIWRLPPGSATLERLVAHEDFTSLQGLALLPGDHALIVADYASGLWHVDVATRAVTYLPAPAGVTLFGIDGLAASGSALIAIQNGVAPTRILRLEISGDGRLGAARVLASALPAVSDPTLGVLADGAFVFAGDAGWNLFSRPGAAPAARPVPILRLHPD